MDFAQQLKASVDIVRVIGEYGVKLRKASPNRYQGLCPFHTEKTPSFSVYTQIQAYKCFGCGATGDVIKFVEQIDSISFYEALKSLAERNNIPMPKRADFSDAETRLRSAIHDMHDLAARTFQASFRGPSASAAREYVARRGITPELVEEFGLGFAEPSGQCLARRFRDEGYSDEQMEKSGLVRRRDDSSFYDYFRGRLIFPIHNETGKIVAFAGRALNDDEPKYLNSPQTAIYQKSRVLYNLNRARKAIQKFDHSVLVEGYMDVIGVFSAGVEEVVASCGTALTVQHVQILKRYSEFVIVNFDPDPAGANAAERSIQMFLEEGVHVKVLELEGDLDPDEYVKQFGAEVYRKKLESATNYFHWLADRAKKKFDMRSAEGRTQGFKFLLPAIQRIPDKLERLGVANDIAAHLGVDAGAVLEQFRKAAGDRKSAPPPPAKATVPAVERILLRAILFDEGAREATLPQLAEMSGLERLVTHRVFAAILACAAQGEVVEFSKVDARLDDASKALLHEVAFADDMDGNSQRAEEALACLKALETSDVDAQRSELRAKVKAAERSGNIEEALRWNKALLKLERSPR
jgi:DNA primase